MTMTEQQQQSQALAIEVAKLAISQIRDTALDTPVIALPENYKLHALDDYISRTSVAFDDVDQFIKYVKAYAKLDEKADLCVGSDLSAAIIFDRGSPEAPREWRHKATFMPTETEEYRALKFLFNRALTQEQMVDFIVDHGDNLTFAAGDTSLSVDKVLQAVRTVTVKQLTESTTTLDDHAESRSLMAQVEARTAKNLVLPNIMTFTFTPYKSFNTTTVVMQFNVKPHNNEPVFKLRMLKKHLFDKSLIDELAGRFESALAEIVDIYHIA